jgi:predicted KAP-like P-loop ATPase
MADRLNGRLLSLPRGELVLIMDRVLERARRETEWGAPPILDAMIALASVEPSQSRRVAGFLEKLPGAAIKPSIVPKIGDEPWSAELFRDWQTEPAISQTVKRAIKARA